MEQSRPLRRATVLTGTSTGPVARRSAVSRIRRTVSGGGGEGLREQIDPGPESLECLHRCGDAEVPTHLVGRISQPNSRKTLMRIWGSEARDSRAEAVPRIASSKYWTMPTLRGPGVSAGASRGAESLQTTQQGLALGWGSARSERSGSSSW